MRLTETFKQFVNSEKSAGILLIVCTLISIGLANSSVSEAYLHLWHINVGGMPLELWINDGLMAIFFLLIGLELERELYSGELSQFRNALLPMMAAVGGMVAPALIHYSLNVNSPTQAGIGIPMATDIAFALGVLAILGDRIPASLKVFVVAFAVIDDLGAAIVIAVFYTASLSLPYLMGAVAIWMGLVALNRLRVMHLFPYLLGGIAMWVCMLKSGVHPTLSGIALAFAIPYSSKQEDIESPSHRLEHILHKPVAYGILPIFALANTGVVIGADWFQAITTQTNSLGIILGLVVGKPLGVALLSVIAVKTGLCKLPSDLRWKHMIGAGILGGIGFTMSIFITNLAFVDQVNHINQAKMAILMASLLAGLLGFFWLKIATKH